MPECSRWVIKAPPEDDKLTGETGGKVQAAQTVEDVHLTAQLCAAEVGTLEVSCFLLLLPLHSLHAVARRVEPSDGEALAVISVKSQHQTFHK